MNADILQQLWTGQKGADAQVKCVGIRGALEKDHGNELGIYDDDFILMIGDAFTEWKGSTDPGQYFIKHPEDPRGCAQLQEGIWLFKPGLHRGRWPAFVQAEDFQINRLDKDGHLTSQQSGDFGIHLHSGGAGVDVNNFSAGCQIIWSKEGYFGASWHRFFDPAVAAMKAAKQDQMPYKLILAIAPELSQFSYSLPTVA
jgi:hypothetical protein